MRWLILKRDEQIVAGLGGLVLLGFILWKYKCQLSSKFNLNLCEDVSHKINYDVSQSIDESELS